MEPQSAFITSALAAGDSATEDTVAIGGKVIAYTAVAGTLTVGSNAIQDAHVGSKGEALPGADQKTPELASAKMFYVAYFKKNTTTDRPISFIYNGGPGGSSLPLHMGAFGPRRVAIASTDNLERPPYKLVNNDYSLLDVSDVVFIDAPGTGFGEISGPDKENAFWGTDPDTHAFERFVRRFVTKYDRWNSPKYLIGESYGTLRNATLAAELQLMDVNGVIMLSQILDFNHNADGQPFSPGVEEANALALPTYAATAYYHHKLPNQPDALEPFLTEVEHYALSEYMSSLLQGSDLTEVRRQAVAEKLHAYTGLTVAFLLKANLRVRAGIFMENLLADEGMTTGQLDARFKGPDLDPLSTEAQYDPAINAVIPAYLAAFNQYVREELKYGKEQTYKPILGSADRFTWDWRHGIPGGPPAGEGPGPSLNAMPDLAYAMKTHPNMKVMLAGGYYDLDTPFFGGIYEMHHLQISQDLQNNISYHYYPSGHMLYVNEDVLRRLHKDVAEFIETSGSKK